MTDAEITTLRVNTTAFERSGGIDAFLEVFGRKILRMEMDEIDGHPIEIDLSLRSLPNCAIASGSISPTRARHTSELIDNDDVVLVAIESGTAEYSQHGRVIRLSPGEAVLTANGAPATFTGLTPTRVINFRLDRALLQQSVRGLDDMVARRLPANGRALQLLRRYSKALGGQPELATNALRRIVGIHIHDLAAITLGSHEQHAAGLMAARMHAVKNDIVSRLADEHLSVIAVASRQCVTPRYVQMLFEKEGTTFTAYLLEQRLIVAHRLLTATGHAQLAIAAIAFETGFSNLSYFNRAFRRRYGMTPSDARAIARGGS